MSPSTSTESFPRESAFFAEGGPVFRTAVYASADGTEQRNGNSGRHPRRVWSIDTAVIHSDYADEAVDFLLDRTGSYQSFRFLDQFDYIATAQPVVAVAGGHQLCMAYTYNGYTYYRPITKPISPVTVTGGGSVNYETGFVTGGGGGTWTGTFEVEARFDNDALAITTRGGSQRSVQARIIEVWDTVPPVITGSTTSENIAVNGMIGASTALPIEIGVTEEYRAQTLVVAGSVLSEDRFADRVDVEEVKVRGKWLLSSYAQANTLLSIFLVGRGRRSRFAQNDLGIVRFDSDSLIMRRVSFDSYEADLAVHRYL